MHDNRLKISHRIRFFEHVEKTSPSVGFGAWACFRNNVLLRALHSALYSVQYIVGSVWIQRQSKNYRTQFPMGFMLFAPVTFIKETHTIIFKVTIDRIVNIHINRLLNTHKKAWSELRRKPKKLKKKKVHKCLP